MKNIHPFRPGEDIRVEARAWVLKFNADLPPTDTDIMALREWTKRSPAHRAALEKAEMFWGDADLLCELAVPMGRIGSKKKRSLFSQSIVSILSVERIAAVTAVMLLGTAIAVSSWLLPIYSKIGNGVYDTAIGEQKTLPLMDESQILLDTNSQIRINYSESTRAVYLLRGKAHFDITKSSDRPFEVYAGGGLVRAVGTAFSVYLVGRDIQVIVDEGRVELARAIRRIAEDAHLTLDESISSDGMTPSIGDLNDNKGTHDIFMSLGKGQSALFNSEMEELRELAEKDLSRELAWRNGLLIFSGDPLRKVVAEVNRYTKTRIEISDPELSDLKIGGRFRVGELEALLDVLEAGFGVQVSYVSKEHIQLYFSSNYRN